MIIMSSPSLDIEYNKRILREVLTRVRVSLKDEEIVYLDLGSGEGNATQFVVNTLKPIASRENVKNEKR
jgi:hypothetical protein